MCVLMATARWAGKERRDVFVYALNFPEILGIRNYCYTHTTVTS